MSERDQETRITLEAGHDVIIGGDFVGRDKIVNSIQHIYQRALTAAEAAKLARDIEVQALAEGVSALAQNLQRLAADPSDAEQGGPYKGLLAYGLSDAEIFFGREQAIREMIARLRRGRLTVLHGESGAGKTSLLQAGLTPRLIGSGHLPILLRANADPALKIKHRFVPDLDPESHLAQSSLRGFLHKVCHVLGDPMRVVFVFIDRFEESFTLLTEPERQALPDQFRIDVDGTLLEADDQIVVRVQDPLGRRAQSEAIAVP